MKKIIRFLSILLSISILFTICISKEKVKAANPFVTRTVDRYGELVETGDAYESIIKYKAVSDGLNEYLLSSPTDLYIDGDDYLYLVDTGSKKVYILDDEYKVVNSFGDDNLIKPTGIYVRNNSIYITDYGTPDDKLSGKIALYDYNKQTNTITFKENRGAPQSKVLEIDNFIYRPEKIAVDSNLTMYVVNEGSYSGILTISDENRFMSYFAPNEVTTSFKDKVTRFLYGENEKVTLKDALPTPPYNVHIDDSGYIYTVTQTVIKNDLGDTLKKVNIGGLNFYPASMLASSEFVAAWNGAYGNIYAATKSGFIYEYDLEGNILFIFGGNSTSIDQLGLFKNISSMVVNSKDELIILDQNDNSFQVFRPTNFASTVHEALGLYNDGKYIESKDLWEDVLVYNSMSDLAHKGIGLAHYLSGDYHAALKEFKLANDKTDYSEAYWEIRNVWISNNIIIVFSIILLIVVGVFVLGYLNKKKQIFAPIKQFFTKLKERKFFGDISKMFRMMRHPGDSTYYLKTDKSIGYYNGLIVLVLIFAIYILGLTCTGFLFNNVVIEKTILIKETFKIIIPIILFVVANYLSSSLLEGEGTFKAIFLTTMASLMPIVVIYPFVILISNVLTFNESFLYYFGIIVMIGWSAILLFVSNKELHNYQGRKMFLNIIMTILLMLVLLIVVILVYLMFSQVIDFIKDIISEVIFHD